MLYFCIYLVLVLIFRNTIALMFKKKTKLSTPVENIKENSLIDLFFFFEKQKYVKKKKLEATGGATHVQKNYMKAGRLLHHRNMKSASLLKAKL